MLASVVARSYCYVMRDHIISEIKRLAVQAGGQAPGSQAFTSATGIQESKWRGKYWARWGDALAEAGFEPNAWTAKSDTNAILDGLAAACRHYGRLPTTAEISMLRASNSAIPAPRTVQNILGSHADMIVALKRYVTGNPKFADVLAVMPEAVPSKSSPVVGAAKVDGSVYLIRSGNFYKIGRSEELERRVKEIRISLPDTATLIHAITTDDPSGIEAYWHRRFADRRANGEWFKLTPEDVKAFLRRKFQ